MADLSPDLSPYAALSRPQQGGLANMDIGSVLGLVQRSRELQTQSAIANALRANPDDPQAALKSVLANPNAFPTAETVSGFAHAAGAQFELNRGYMREAAGAMGSLVTKPNATVNDFSNIVPLLRQYNVPQAMIDDVMQSASGPNGILDRNKLTSLYNWISGNAGVPLRTTQTPTGEITQPAGTALYPGAAAGGGATPSPRSRPQNAPSQPQGSTAPQQIDVAQQALDSVRSQQPSFGVSGGTSVAPSQEQQATRGQSTAQYTQDLAKNYQNATIPMTKSIELLLKNGPNFTGRGTTEINNIKNFLNTMGIIPNDQMDKVVDFESMKKYMEQFINENSAGGTDARLWQSIAGSPSPDKLQRTNLNLSRVALGLARMKQVALDEFQRVGGQPGEYQRWFNTWAKQQDPMAFVWDTMTKEEQQDYANTHWKNQPNSVWQQFERSLNAGQRSSGVMK